MWNDEEDEKQENVDLQSTGKRYTLAEKLRDALQHSDTQYTESTDDSYAVDISISGSKTDADEGIRFVPNIEKKKMNYNDLFIFIKFSFRFCQNSTRRQSRFCANRGFTGRRILYGITESRTELVRKISK